MAVAFYLHFSMLKCMKLDAAGFLGAREQFWDDSIRPDE